MLSVIIPLRTGSGLNAREHWQARARRVKAERQCVAWSMAKHKAPAGPVVVLMRRVSPSARGLDSDNLQGGLKAVRDEIARWLGRDDADPSITWAYAQRKGTRGQWLVEVEISAHEECA